MIAHQFDALLLALAQPVFSLTLYHGHRVYFVAFDAPWMFLLEVVDWFGLRFGVVDLVDILSVSETDPTA
jgi:hypothetical protein